MPSRVRVLKLIVLFTAICASCVLLLSERAASGNDGRERIPLGARKPPPPPAHEPFNPSNARTENGELIPVEQFFPASRCVNCHQDTHTAWSESLHRNAAREPFYRESADILLRTRGIEFTRHCESCHTPVALFSGALSKGAPRQQAPFTEMDDEGVSCSVCHSITEARLNGTGSYTIRRPALLAREDNTPIYGDITDEQILADVPGHKRAVMRPLLKQPEFCATCHKVDSPPSLNGYKHLRGFSAYDEWQQSGASRETVSSYYRSEQRIDCRSCHMPKVESLNDRASKKGVIASHRWLGANTAAPLFYGQTKQAELVKEFLESKVVSVDIFALKREASGETLLSLGRSTKLSSLTPGEELTAEVVVSNRKAAHSLPPEVRDLYELWVEFEAIDASGKTIFHTGFIKPNGRLDESAHTYKAILLDESGRTITRHQIWTTTIKAYDNAIQSGRSDIARFRFRLPDNLKPVALSNVTLRARFNYRRFIQEYAEYISRVRKQKVLNPIAQMAESEVRLISEKPIKGKIKDSHHARAKGGQTDAEALPAEQAARRWNDYGIGLLEQAQYGPAADAFRRANQLNPRDQNLLVNAAIAEMRTERFGPDLTQLKKAADLLEAALKIDPADARTLFFHALLLRSQGKLREAAAQLAEIAKQYPRDREVHRQLGQTLYTLGDIKGALEAFEAIVAVDPTDAGAYQFLTPIYTKEGRSADAVRSRGLYYQWRDDPMVANIAARFFAVNPQWAEERVVSHMHGIHSAPRPTLAGSKATPER